MVLVLMIFAGQSPKFSVQESGAEADQEVSHWVTGVPSTKSYTKGKDSYESEGKNSYYQLTADWNV